MRHCAGLAAILAVLGAGCIADDVVSVEPRPPTSARARSFTGVDSAPPTTDSAANAIPTKPPPTAAPTKPPAPTPAPPSLTNPPPPTERALPADLEPLFAGANKEQPPGERTVELIAVASARMRDDPRFAPVIGDRLEPICAAAFFTPQLLSGMERLGLRRHAVRKGESPWKIARALGTEPAYVTRVNPDAVPTSLHIGQRLKVLDLASADLEVVIDLAAARLTLFRLPADGGGAQMLMHAPIASGAGATPTPRGTTRIERVVVNPLYVDPKSGAKHGPLDPKNPWGAARIALEGAPLGNEKVEVHGGAQDEVGGAVTDGDIWLANADLVRLTECVRVGTRVVIR
jgi:lipoprotein-anchoring transpeptidase ErfK/SrfK